jgi:putative transposase
MLFKLSWPLPKISRRLKSATQLPKGVQGVTFRDGVEVADTPAQSAA